MSQYKPTKAERADFAHYLRQCTNQQVLGVMAKEREARRSVYMQLATREAERRGLISARVLRAGALAYFDSMGGLVPCKVLRIEGPSGAASSRQCVTFRVAATRGPWSRGEVLSASGLWVLPRNALKRSQYGNRIRFYTVEPGQA